MTDRPFFYLLITILCFLQLGACESLDSQGRNENILWENEWKSEPVSFGKLSDPLAVDIPVKRYFQTIDSLLLAYDSTLSYPLTEHLLVRANPWIIDSLAATDYYLQAQRGNFVYDQKVMIVLPKGSRFLIPDSLLAGILLEKQRKTLIDVNVPEFKLRILEGEKLVDQFPVRIGQNKKGFIPLVGRTVDWRTSLGKGRVVGLNRNPVFHNLSTGKAYEYTRRDDGKTTLMPQIPSIEPEIEGVCTGQLIHATTNPRTLGLAYSHGCVGVRERDAWRIYYYAPLGTRVRFRYDLTVLNEAGDTLFLEDVYNLFPEREETSGPTIILP